MKNIQEYIDFLKAEKEKALRDIEIYKDGGDTPHWHGMAVGKDVAFSDALTKAQLLLNPNFNSEQQRSELLAAFAWISTIGEQFFKGTIEEQLDAYLRRRQ